MKKILLYILSFIILFFILPIIFTITPKAETEEVVSNIENVTQEQPEQEVETTIYDYQKYKTIKLFHSGSGQIEELPIDEYLYGVVSSEMPANYEAEALKAQAIVARTYTIYQIMNNSGKHPGADICDNSSCCQAWISKDERLSKWAPEEAESNWNKIVDAVN